MLAGTSASSDVVVAFSHAPQIPGHLRDIMSQLRACMHNKGRSCTMLQSSGSTWPLQDPSVLVGVVVEVGVVVVVVVVAA